VGERKTRQSRLIIGLAVIAVAALIGAGIALAGPLRQLGASPAAPSTPPLLTSPTVATPSQAAPGLTVKPARTVAELQQRVPTSFRRTCIKLAPEAPQLRAALVVALQCTPVNGTGGGRQPEYSFYLQYPDGAAAKAAFRGYYAAGQAPTGDCKKASAEKTYTRDGASGTLRCYSDPQDYQVFAWTDDDLGILSSAADRTMTYAQLESWWERAGPIH